MNPNADRRKTRVNRLKYDGHCSGCGGRIPIWFAVEYCTGCMMGMRNSFYDMRHDKPTLVRYKRDVHQ